MFPSVIQGFSVLVDVSPQKHITIFSKLGMRLTWLEGNMTLDERERCLEDHHIIEQAENHGFLY